MLPEAPLAIHEKILKACAQNLSVGGYSFEFVMGDSFELNNDSDNVVKPVLCLEQESVFELGKNGDITEIMTVSIMFLSNLGDSSNERTNYYNLAQQAVLQLQNLLERIRIDSLNELVFNPINGFNLGEKILLGFEVGQVMRAKNKYSSNRDGCIINNLKMKIRNNLDYCAI